MDVLRPQLIWIGNQCYRKNPIANNEGFNPEDEELDDEEGVSSAMTYCDEPSCDSLDIEETNKGFRLTVKVPPPFYKFIIGKQGVVKKGIETDTQTRIIVPKPADKRQEIVINGHHKKGIVSAKTRIDVLVESARQKQGFTHFLSIQVTSDEVVMAFEDFKFQVLCNCEGDQGLDASLFQNPSKLHLTIGTLVLLDEEEIKKAVTLLKECQEELVPSILKNESLNVQVKGLEYMNDDPGAVDVLYAKIESGEALDRLQILTDQLVDKFTSSGLMQRQYEAVKLHITLMNTLFRKDPSGTDIPKPLKASNKPRESFDASGILKKYGNFHFGSLCVSSIHLSQRFSSGEDGYYKSVESLILPR